MPDYRRWPGGVKLARAGPVERSGIAGGKTLDRWAGPRIIGGDFAKAMGFA